MMTLNFYKLLQVLDLLKLKILIEKNITFNNLINNPSEQILKELTHHQKLGIKYYYYYKKYHEM